MNARSAPTNRLTISLLAAPLLLAAAACSAPSKPADATRAEQPPPAGPTADEPTDDEPAGAPRPDPAPAPDPDHASAPDPAPARLSPFVTLDPAARTVTLVAEVSPLVDPSGEGRAYYLETLVCTRSTKEHESLLVTDGRASTVHAALLALGLEPGSPARWNYEPDGDVTITPATGPALDVRFVLHPADPDRRRELSPFAWVVDRETGRPFAEGPAADGVFVFAGSNERTARGHPFYEADAAGTLLGLADFGSEAVAWSIPISHEEAAGDLEWIANETAMPEPGTTVHVVFRPAESD